MKSSIVVLFFTLLATSTAVQAGRVTMCKDENGQKYFTDKGCPKNSVSRKRVAVSPTNTINAKESIDLNRLNDYERRTGSNTRWRWEQKRQ